MTEQDEEVQRALQTLQKFGIVPSRGDSFDLDSSSGGGAVEQIQPTNIGTINTLLSNPQEFLGMNLTDKQKKNVRSAIVGGGAGLGHNVLSGLFGDELGGMIGAGLAGWLAKKMVK